MMTVHTKKIKDESSDPILTINIIIIRKILDMKVYLNEEAILETWQTYLQYCNR